jgi:hypothetical protein
MALPSWLRDWASHEQGTRRLRDWCPSVVTGLLQTEDYAREVSAMTPCVAEDEVSAVSPLGWQGSSAFSCGKIRPPRGSWLTTSRYCAGSARRK